MANETSTKVTAGVTGVIALLLGGLLGANLFPDTEVVKVPELKVEKVTQEVVVTKADPLVVAENTKLKADLEKTKADLTLIREQPFNRYREDDRYWFNRAVNEAEDDFNEVNVCDGREFDEEDMKFEDEDLNDVDYDIHDEDEVEVSFDATIDYDGRCEADYEVTVKFEDDRARSVVFDKK